MDFIGCPIRSGLIKQLIVRCGDPDPTVRKVPLACYTSPLQTIRHNGSRASLFAVLTFLLAEPPFPLLTFARVLFSTSGDVVCGLCDWQRRLPQRQAVCAPATGGAVAGAAVGGGSG